MRTRKLLVLSAFAAACLAGAAVALDSPHDGSFAASVTECQSCHKLHGSLGGTLLQPPYTSNNHACLACHQSASATTPSPNNLFAGDWSSGREAVPGTGGDQHNWSAAAVNATVGTRAPVTAAMSANLSTGNLQCAVCHDVHGLRDATKSIQADLVPATSVHSSMKVGVTAAPMGGGTATMQLVSITGAKPNGYRVQIVTGGSPTGTFRVSRNYDKATHDGTAVTWSAAMPYTSGSTATFVAPEDTAVQIRFNGTPVGGATPNEWRFYVSYPFLSTSNTLDDMCVDCHTDRDMTHACVEGSTCTAGAGQVFSHPVKEAMGVVGGTTVAAAAMLDADGTVGSSSTDGLGGVPNPGNDLKLVGGNVSCTTCHAPHNADSNSLTVDVR